MNTETSASKDHTPVYNIKAVARLVDLLPVTLRAWERRYGLPTPQRGGQGYRLYSEYDVRTLRWLKAQVDAGMSIGRAVEYLAELRQNNNDPALAAPAQIRQALGVGDLSGQLLAAISSFNEPAAVEIIRRAFGVYSVDQVMSEVITPVMVAIGEGWERGETPIATEHFATQLIMRHLLGMAATIGQPVHTGTVVAACMPGEHHEIGLLMVVILLRWRGRDVLYLGADMNLDDLPRSIGGLRPKLVLFSAARAENAQAVQQLPDILAQFPQPRPRVILGGQGFRQLAQTAQLPFELIDGPVEEIIQRLEMILDANHPNGHEIAGRNHG